METQKAILLIVGILVAGLLIGRFTGEATRKQFIGDGPSSGCSDEDNDKFYRTSRCGTLIDCNDNDPYINPNAEEICGNSIDENCDGTSIICQGNIEIIAKKTQYGQEGRVTLI